MRHPAPLADLAQPPPDVCAHASSVGRAQLIRPWLVTSWRRDRWLSGPGCSTRGRERRGHGTGPSARIGRHLGTACRTPLVRRRTVPRRDQGRATVLKTVNRERSGGGSTRMGRTLVMAQRNAAYICTLTCLLLVCGAVCCYATGFFAGFSPGYVGYACGALRDDPSFVRLAFKSFPPSAVCVFRGGVTRQLVPAWVNPALFSCLVGIVPTGLAAAASAVRDFRRRRRHGGAPR